MCMPNMEALIIALSVALYMVNNNCSPFTIEDDLYVDRFVGNFVAPCMVILNMDVTIGHR